LKTSILADGCDLSLARLKRKSLGDLDGASEYCAVDDVAVDDVADNSSLKTTSAGTAKILEWPEDRGKLHYEVLRHSDIETVTWMELPGVYSVPAVQLS
jgi:hypothetical protein